MLGHAMVWVLTAVLAPEPGRAEPAPDSSATARSRPPPPVVVTAKVPRRRDEVRPVDRSRGGTRRGGLDIALGAVAAVVTGVLIGRGVWEELEAHRLDCGTTDHPECRTLPQKRGHHIAAGLSFAFAVPIGVAAGFLLAHGILIERDHRRFHRAKAKLGVFSGGWTVRFAP